MSDTIYVPKAALILSRSTSALGKLIRWGETTWHEDGARVNHSILVVEAGHWPPPECEEGAPACVCRPDPLIIESDTVVRTGPLSKYHANDKLVIYDIEMTEEERALVAGDAGHHSGRPYAVGQLFLQLIDNKLLCGTNVFRRLAKLDPLDICSHLTGDALGKVGIELGEPGYATSPDDQDDFLRTHAETADGRRITCLLDEIGA